jgi:hypothetical protein
VATISSQDELIAEALDKIINDGEDCPARLRD